MPTDLPIPWRLRRPSVRSLTKLLQCGGNTILRCGIEDRQHPVERSVAALPEADGNGVDATDDGESVQHVVIDERAHGVPLPLQGQAMQFGVQVTPAV